jgi:diguanylate cyclase (GGDEF)-like protein
MRDPRDRKLLRRSPVAHVGSTARRYALGLRIAIGLVVSVLFLVVASQIFFTHAISQELVNQGARSYGAEATALERAYDDGSGPADSLDDVLDLVDSIADRPGISSAILFDSDMRKVVAPRDSGLPGVRDPNPKFDAALRDGRSYAGAETETGEHGSHFEFIMPVTLDGGRYVLEVDQDGTALHTQVRSLRDRTVLFTTIALLIAMAIFYAVGGRALARRHRSVLKRATRDPLTDLGNHRMFQEELTRAVAAAARRGEPLAVVLVDLDDFKFVNDRFGHRRGDEVLSDIARVLESGRAGDQAFRIGGDEFAILMPGSDGERARIVLDRFLADARRGAAATSFTAGVVVLTPGSHEDPAALWEQADAALYEGKRSGSGTVVVFDDVAELLSVVTPDKVSALRSLLEEPRLEIAFQPIWRLQDHDVLGFEALARPWGGYGFTGPAEAFAVAEKVGRAQELDAICRAAALSRANELPEDALLFLNVHPQSLARDTLGGDRLVRAVEAVGFDPQRVVLEITERSDARLAQVVADATRLRSLGFRLALDDVGAGNAGLEMLRELPVDFVKIDQSVITAAIHDLQGQAVLVAIIAYARQAEAFVIAEGIESEEILAFVRHTQDLEVMRNPAIDGGQGFLLGRPSSDLSRASASAWRPRLAA